jgi:sulfur carrier protein
LSTITVVSNGRPVELPEGATVTDLLTALQLEGKWVLVERNGEPVERRLLDRTVLVHGDRLELVRAVAGG